MALLWYFNPWNDLALGSDSVHYTPSPSVGALTLSGETLPMWMAAPDDYVLVSERGEKWWRETGRRYGLARPWRGEPVEKCVPWGWSKAVKTVFRDAGVDDSILPSDETLDRLRSLSHRRLTIEIHRYLSSGLEPFEAFDEAECGEFLEANGTIVGKYPWSSTGRGLFSGEREYEESFLRRCRGCLNSQGSVMLERRLDVVQEFAMLFYSDGGGSVGFRGYSMFMTNNRAYVGNLIMSDREMVRRLDRYVPTERLEAVAEGLGKFLSQRIGKVYEGFLGVDMMVYRDIDGEFRLNPCVELNLRNTMGVLAMMLRNRYLPSGFEGRLLTETGTFSADSTVLVLNPSDSAFRFIVR